MAKKKKFCFIKTTVSQDLKKMAKLYEFKIDLLLHQPYSADLAPSDYWLFEDLKKMVAGKKFLSNEGLINETEAYFEAKDKSIYKNGF